MNFISIKKLSFSLKIDKKNLGKSKFIPAKLLNFRTLVYTVNVNLRREKKLTLVSDRCPLSGPHAASGSKHQGLPSTGNSPVKCSGLAFVFHRRTSVIQVLEGHEGDE